MVLQAVHRQPKPTHVLVQPRTACPLQPRHAQMAFSLPSWPCGVLISHLAPWIMLRIMLQHSEPCGQGWSMGGACRPFKALHTLSSCSMVVQLQTRPSSPCVHAQNAAVPHVAVPQSTVQNAPYRMLRMLNAHLRLPGRRLLLALLITGVVSGP